MSELPTPMQIRKSFPGLTSRMVAEKAGVSLTTEYLMEIGGSVKREEAEKFINAFSTLVGIKYSLTAVGGFIIKEQENDYLDKLRQRGGISRRRTH